MKHDNNDIVNVVVKQPNYNVIDIGRYERSKQVEVIADKLVDKLGVPIKSRPFMCKAAYKLSEARIWDNLEQAMKGKNPVGLFIWLCKRDGV